MYAFISDMQTIHSKIAGKDTKTTIIKVVSKKSSLNVYQKQQKRNKNTIQVVVVWSLHNKLFSNYHNF